MLGCWYHLRKGWAVGMASYKAWVPDMHINIMGQSIPVVVREKTGGWYVCELHAIPNSDGYSARVIAHGNTKAEALNNAIRYLSIG